jgi:pyrroline-5-carboxylate reductase
LNSRAQNVSSSTNAFAPTGANGAANSAGQLSILPSSSAVKLSFENIIALQSLIDEPAQLAEMSATEKFLEEARKSPIERMREQVLESLGLTEEALAQMPPQERRAAEDKIRELIEEKIRQAMNADDQPTESNSAMLQSLVGA